MTEEKKQTDEELRAKFEASMKRERRRPPRRKKPAEDRAADPHLRRGKIAGISDKEVFVDLGPKVQGVIAIDEFESPPAIGEEFEFTMVSVADDLWTLSRQEARKLETWRELAVGKWVTARIIGFNSGGLEVKIGPVAAFVPVSQVEPRQAKDLAACVGEEMVCEVTEANARRKRVVVSRRKVLDKERRRQREETLASLAVGQVVRGKVEKIEPFGAFVGIGGGLTGLLHVSNLAHQRVKDPSEVLSVGDEVEVQVLEIKERGKRIGLGRKQLQAHPWDDLDERLHAEEVTQGKVTRIAEFGAFVEVEPGVEGLLHISQLGPDRVARVEDAIKVGEEVLVRVQSIECERRRLSLSRLNSRGALLGSEEDDETPTEGEPSTPTAPSTRIFKEGKVPTTSTNLGDLLREAMKDNK